VQNVLKLYSTICDENVNTVNYIKIVNLFVFLNRLVGGTGERYDRHDMENNRHLVSRSDRLQSRQVLTGNVYLRILYKYN